MKKWIFYFLFLQPMLMFGQFGVKAGLNWADVTNTSSINTSARTGYHFGIIMDRGKSVLGSRTELMYSKQGYNFESNINTGHVDLDYIILPQFLTINVTSLVQLQIGLQTAYLLNADVDSTNMTTGNPEADKVLSLMNRFNYGVGAGVEVRPFSLFLAGARMNLSFGNLFKEPEPGEAYSFIPKVDTKSNLFQLYVGLKFGKKDE